VTIDSKHNRPPLGSRTRQVHLGRDRGLSHGFVNVPPFRGSTVLFPNVAALERQDQRFTYGTHDTPTTEMLREAWTDLSGAAGTVLVPSGLAAIVVALQAAVSAGDHLLVVDTAYTPTRIYCERTLKRFGVETTYYDPALGAEVAALFRHNTKAIVVESPGSQSMEVQDVPAIAAEAAKRGICVILDNTWATPLNFMPHAHGVDICIEAGTKYLGGHSDILLGLVTANKRWFKRLHASTDIMGVQPGSEEVFLALRGLRTMELRLREAERQAMAMARWFRQRDEVARVLYPALPDCPGHDIWKRDFTGASGLFSVVLKPASKEAVAAMLDGLELFGIGWSWGGYESLVIPFDCAPYRTATTWAPGGPTLRFSIGLEDIADLQDDLARGFERLSGAQKFSRPSA